MNLDEYADIGTYWIALYALNNNATYFDSFGVEHIPKEINKFIKGSSITKNIYRKQAYNSIQQCVNIFVLTLLVLGLKVKV